MAVPGKMMREAVERKAPRSMPGRGLGGKQERPRFRGRKLRRWSERDSNPRHEDFQSSALPTELSDRVL